MIARFKKNIGKLVSVVLIIAMAFQSIAAPVSFAGPAAAEPAKVTGTWSQDAAGNWSFRSQDGAAKDGWYYLNTGNHSAEYNWFCFDANGVMRTGWVEDKNDPSVWYYTGESKDGSEGGLVKGWITDPQDGKKYYLDPSTGIMCHGWKQISGVWYYFGESRYADRRWGQDSSGYWTDGKSGKHTYGALYMNEYTPDGYYVGANGAWVQNHSEDDNSDKPDPIPAYGIIVEADGHGTAKAQVGGADVTSAAPGAAVTLVATANDGYAFKEWEIVRGLDSITGNSFTMPSKEVKVKAVFEKEYAVEAEAGGHGTVSADVAKGVSGKEVNLTITPDEGYETDQITVVRGGVTVVDNKFKIGTADVKIRVTFKAIVPSAYGIIVEADGHGTAKAQVGGADVTSAAPGAAVTLVATANDGYAFKEWEIVRGLDSITGNSFTMPSKEVKVKAIFERVYNITLQTNEHGTASATVGGKTVTTAAASTEVALTATPAEGYQFKEWKVVSGDVSVTENKFTMPAGNVTVQAVFEAIAPATYTVTFASAEHGAIYDAATSGKKVTEISVASGTTVSTDGNKITIGDTDYYAVADSGYKFKEFSGSVPETITAATTITPVFEADTLSDGYYLIYITDDTTINDTNSSMKLTEDATVPGQYKLDWTFTIGEKIKVVKVENNAIAAWYPDGLDTEHTITAQEAGERTLLFSTEYKNEWSAWGGYFKVQPKVVIHTIEDVLKAVKNEFPTSFDSGWYNSDKYDNEYKCYTESGNLVFDYDYGENKVSFALDSAVTESSGDYTFANENAALTFKMTDGELTGIAFEYVNISYQYFNGTYVPPVTMTIGEILAEVDGFPAATKEKPIPDNAYIAVGGFKAFIDGDSLKFMDKDGGSKSIALSCVAEDQDYAFVYTEGSGDDAVMYAFTNMYGPFLVMCDGEDFGGYYGPAITVTFDMKGHGTQISPKTDVAFGSSSEDLPEPESVQDYKFDGWYADEDLEEEVEMIMADTTVYAKWTYAGPVDYLEWNPATKEMEKKTVSYGTGEGQYTLLKSIDYSTTLEAGKFYVVSDDATIRGSIVVEGTEEKPTYLILCDEKKLTVMLSGPSSQYNALIQVTADHALNICGQENGTGQLSADHSSNSSYAAAIGGNDGHNGKAADCGSITINGGIVEAKSVYGAAIGGGTSGNGGTVTINGGTVQATSNNAGAAIGSGAGVFKYGADGGIVTINGGTVTAINTSTGTSFVGAGIGGGYGGSSGTVTINGGDVTARGGNQSPGIGGGYPVNIEDPEGTVVAYGGNGGTVTINGGTVKATGGAGAAGIGGSQEFKTSCVGGGNGGTVIINGGSVEAVAGEGAEAIGKGKSIDSGSLNTSGTVEFGTGVNFTINAGADKDNTESKTTAQYSEDHSAAYVSIEESAAPTKTVADILPTEFPNEDFDKLFYDDELPLNPWVKDENFVSCVLDYSTSQDVALINKDNLIDFIGCDLNEKLVKGDNENTWVCTNTFGTFTFVVEDGAFTQITFSDNVGSSDYERFDGTYTAPAAVTPKYMDWDAGKKELVEKPIPAEAIEVTNATTTTLDAGKFYVVKGADVQTGTIIVNGTADKPTTLILADGAKLTVTGQVESYAAIQVTNDGSTCHALTITGQKNGTGTLIVTNAKYAAGIGGNDSDLKKHDADCGIITVNGGIIETTGGQCGAGIGGGYNGNGGTVNINGGTVTATGGYGSAGIGGGSNNGTGGNGGTVTINGGTVTATGGYYGAGIGGGNNGTGGTVTINGGTVTATGGNSGAGIGGGLDGNGGTVTINGGNVTATAGKSAEAIGKGKDGTESGTVTFGEGVTFTINAGDDKEHTSSMTTAEYSSNHSAAYVSIEESAAPPAKLLKSSGASSDPVNDAPMAETEVSEPTAEVFEPEFEPEKFEEAKPEELIEPAEAVAEEAAP